VTATRGRPADERKLLRAGHAAVLLVQGIAFVAFLKPWSREDGFPLDDAWIHQVVARTLARTGTLGYVPGKFGSGATSYLWASMLAPNYAFLHVDPVVYTLVVNVLLWAACGHLALRILLRAAPSPFGDDRLDMSRAALAAAVACAGGNFLWFAFSGMEALLLAALSLAAVLLVTEEGARSARRSGWCGVCLGAIVFARPESAALGLVLTAWCGWRRRRPRDIGLMLAGWLGGVAGYTGLNLLATGHALPATLEGRRWMWLELTAGQSKLAGIDDFVAEWALRLRNYSLGTSSTLVFWVALGLALAAVGDLVRRRNHAALLLVVWAVLHVAVYGALMPMVGHGGRYQPLTPFVFLLLSTYGAVTLATTVASLVTRRDAATGVRARLGLVATLVGAAPGVVFCVLGILTWREAHAAAIAPIRVTEAGVATVFNALPPQSKVASFDIGASGFFADRPVLDLGGLTDPATVPILKTGRIWTYMKANGVEYVALPLGYDDRVPDLFNFGYRLHLFANPSVELTEVAMLGSPPEVWIPGVSATMHSAPRQGVYRVRYPAPPPSTFPAELAAHFRVEDAGERLGPEVRGQLEYGMRALAARGLSTEVRVGATDDDPPVEVGGPLLVLVRAADQIRVVLPARLRAIPQDAADALLHDATAPFAATGDLGGAVRASLSAVTLLVQRWVDPTFAPLLAPIPFPAPAHVSETPRTTLGWGLALALVLAALAETLSRRDVRARSRQQ
jgi:hypothetical protein